MAGVGHRSCLEKGAGEMDLRRPEWFAGLSRWWLPAVGEDVADNVAPLGLDGQGRLHVTCRSRAWRVQIRLLERPLAARVNRFTPVTVTRISVVDGTAPR
ncbi:DUF721 domain-containing protein [Kitasatospora sp. NPDC004669]|uniref:DUF721 domain-containing protein n=1 Tax=Kitasatospora sp. NPDC004669 TaxID=3154555 RepID=UPI0033B26300